MRSTRSLLACLSLPLFLACGGGGGGGGSAPTPAITFPQAGAVLAGTNTITWVSPQNPGTVEIRLSNNGGQSFGTQLAAGIADTGSFTWDTTGSTDGSNYRLAITPTNPSSVAGGAFSNSANFSVDNAVPVTTLVSPQAGDIFGGVNAMITWMTTDSNPGTVRISLSSDSGATFPMVLAAAAPDSGAFQFDATALAEVATYRVRVQPTDMAGNVGSVDESTGDAEIDNTLPTITLSSPVGGELLASVHDVTYVMTDTHPERVEILLSSDSGANYDEVITLTAPVVGPFAWNTALIEDGTTYRVRLVAVDQAGNRSNPADSPADFALENIVLKQAAYFIDDDQDGLLDTGDRLFLAFNEEIVLNSPSVTDFQMYVPGDSVGTGAMFTDLNLVGEMSIDFGTGMSFRARGDFDPAIVTAGSPSGVDVADMVAADAIENVSGTDVAPIGGVNIDAGFENTRLESGSDMGTSCDAGDIDGDGDLDLVIGRGATLGVAVRIQNALGEYPLSAGSPIGADTVNDVMFADFNGDGDLDIVSGNAGANRIYFGDGTGGFVNSGQVLGSGITLSLAVGDLDGDGDLDIVSGNDFSSPIRTFHNNGSGVFTQTGQALGGSDTNDMALGDVDNDGDLDLLAGNQGGGTSNRIWKNDGNGSFTMGSSVLVTQTQRVGLADLDGDGDLDAVIAVTGQNETSFNDGAGNFSASSQVFSNGDHRGLALADFDEDGDIDALITKFTDRDELFLNDGDGNFGRRMSQNIGNLSATDVVTGDFDRDGDLDYFTPGGLANEDAIWGYCLSGVYGPTTLVEGADLDVGTDTTTASAALHANADGNLDLAVVRGNGLELFLGQGDGTFGAAQSTVGSSGDAVQLLARDVNADGNMDLILVQAALRTNLFLGNGTGGFSLSMNAFGTAVASSVAAGDLDGDGNLDVVLGLAGMDDQIHLGDGSGGFTLSLNVIANTNTQAVALGDFDRDGDLDAFVGGASGTFYASNDGAGLFTLNMAATTADDTLCLQLLDADGDGDLDVFAGTNGSGVRVITGDGAGALVGGAAFASGIVTSLAVSDMNYNGSVDAIVGTGATLANQVFLNNGLGMFGMASQTLGTGGVDTMTLADFDRDGDLDLFQGRAGEADVTWSIQ